MSKQIYRPLTLILSLVLIITMFIPTFGVTSTNDYSSHWAGTQIQSALNEGIVNGYPDGSFKPNDTITHAEIMAMINNQFEFSLESEMVFSDVSANAWYASVVAKAVAAKYIIPKADGSIHPTDLVSRQDVAVILSRLKSLTALASDSAYTDFASVSSNNKNAVIALYESGIMRGYPDFTFRPEVNINRAEALVTIQNAYKYMKVSTDVINPANPIDLEGVQSSTAPVNLGMAGDYVILSKSGISTVPNSVITGNIGVSPIGATAVTGFSLTADATNQFATSAQVTGKVYASTYTSPTPSNLTTAVSNMEAAYTDAAGRATDYTELYSGDISGRTLTAGVYKWGTGILMTSDVTLSGGPNDVWIFQIGEGITQADGAKIILTGGAQAKNIFWQAAETVTIGTGSHFEGIVLCQTNITLGNLSSINGRLFAQTAVTLDASTVVAP